MTNGLSQWVVLGLISLIVATLVIGTLLIGRALISFPAPPAVHFADDRIEAGTICPGRPVRYSNTFVVDRAPVVTWRSDTVYSVDRNATIVAFRMADALMYNYPQTTSIFFNGIYTPTAQLAPGRYELRAGVNMIGRMPAMFVVTFTVADDCD